MVGIRHKKVATLPDEVGAEINKAEWNDTHAIDANTIGDAEIASHTTTKITVPTTQLSGTVSNSQVATGIDAAKIGSGTVSNTEFGYLDGVTSALQTQIDGKQASGSYITASSTDTLTNKTIDADGTGNSITNIENADIKAAAAIALNKLAATTASRALVSDGSGFISAATTTGTEIGYVNGVTSAIQTQINSKGTKERTITVIIDGGGSVITTGVKAYLEIPFACTIVAATTLADVSGSIVIDVWKDTYANYPPTVADTITASAKPTISSATKAQDSTLTGWTTSVSAGDILGFNVDSATTVTRVTLSLKVNT